MKIPLNQFELCIDEPILRRGLSYFKNGNVHEPEEITNGIFEAIVEGTDDYTVKMIIKNGSVEEYVCSCPYDMGPVCKHIVAVLFYLQQDELNIKPKSIPLKKQTPKEKKSKKKTVADEINELLESISLDELQQFIREKTTENPPFRNLFLYSFAHKSSDDSQQKYTKQIKQILRIAAGRYKFIFRNNAGYVGKEVRNLLNIAEKQFNNNHYKSTVYICCAVMEELTKALNFADDSNADISGNIEFACEFLFKVAKEKISEEIRNLLFKYCISAFEKQLFIDWDWHLEMLQLATELLKNEAEATQITNLLDTITLSEYEKQEAQTIKLNIIKKTQGETAANKFIAQHISNPNFRREVISKFIHLKDFEKAQSLAKDGIKQDEKNKPGLATEWYNWLLKIAMAQKDNEKIITYARLLFIHNFNNQQDYYQILKNNVPSERWSDFVEEIIRDILKTNRWQNFDLIAKIFINEKWWDRLLLLLQQSPSLRTIENYEKHLSKDYSPKLVELYATQVLEYMQDNVGRNYYQTVCRYLRRMIKLGGRETAEKIILILRTKYPQRKALMDELNKV
ncbi:MAG: SWIM zinc finger family protein [Lutibacter sp.]|nr:SWIM zinc finger family protein [Lutibacter sp.]